MGTRSYKLKPYKLNADDTYDIVNRKLNFSLNCVKGECYKRQKTSRIFIIICMQVFLCVYAMALLCPGVQLPKRYRRRQQSPWN